MQSLVVIVISNLFYLRVLCVLCVIALYYFVFPSQPVRDGSRHIAAARNGTFRPAGSQTGKEGISFLKTYPTRAAYAA